MADRASIASLRLLVDPEAVRRRLERLPNLGSAPLSTPRPETFWVKPGRHFNACYSLVGAGAQRIKVSGFALADAALKSAAAHFVTHSCGGARRTPCGACSTFADDAGVLWQLFPLDYRLPTLSECLDVERIGSRIGTIESCEPVGYRPGMRCQIRYRTPRGEAIFGKVAVERIPGEAAQRHERMERQLSVSRAKLRLAPARMYFADLNLSLIDGVAGESLHARLQAERATPAEAREIAVALASLHELDLDGVERIYRTDDELVLVDGWVELTAALFPELAEPLRDRYRELAAARPATPGPTRIVHRDFYDKQIMMSARGIVLLDMDTACRGDAEIDLGNFCAHLELRALQWSRPRAFADLGATFLDSYPLPLERERVRWYRAVALLRLACVYAVRPHWRHLAPALAAMAKTT